MARVRNIKPLNQRPGSNIRPIETLHFIPPAFSPAYKIEVVTDNEVLDLTDMIYEGEFSDGVTEAIGDFYFRIIDPNNTISLKIEEFDSINIYLDYGTNATTLRFTGKIERKSNVEQIWLDISGRSIAMITTGVNVTYKSNGEKFRSIVLSEIVDKYFGGIISTSAISEDSINIDVNYSEVPFWSIVEELCEASGYDAYIDTDLVLNYFPKNIRKNTTEAIVENVNLVATDDFAKDTQEIVTQVRVYGNSIGNIPIISSSISDTTKTKGIVKDLAINNSSIATPVQARALAISNADSKKYAPTIGTITSLLTPTILPGESIRIANPTNNISPGYYDIISYTHKFSSEYAPETIFTIKKSRLNTSLMFKKIFQAQNNIYGTSNPQDMDATIIYDYNVNVGEQLFNYGVKDNILIELDESTGVGVIRVETGDVGSWTSKKITLDRNLTAIYLKHTSTNIGNAKFFVSLDNGSSFSEISAVYNNIIFNGLQNTIILRVDIKSSTTAISEIGLYYK